MALTVNRLYFYSDFIRECAKDGDQFLGQVVMLGHHIDGKCLSFHPYDNDPNLYTIEYIGLDEDKHSCTISINQVMDSLKDLFVGFNMQPNIKDVEILK